MKSLKPRLWAPTDLAALAPVIWPPSEHFWGVVEFVPCPAIIRKAQIVILKKRFNVYAQLCVSGLTAEQKKGVECMT